MEVTKKLNRLGVRTKGRKKKKKGPFDNMGYKQFLNVESDKCNWHCTIGGLDILRTPHILIIRAGIHKLIKN